MRGRHGSSRKWQGPRRDLGQGWGVTLSLLCASCCAACCPLICTNGRDPASPQGWTRLLQGCDVPQNGLPAASLCKTSRIRAPRASANRLLLAAP